MRVICSGGGTGGHIFPAVAVAQEIKKRNPSAEVLFIGAKGKMEMTKVPKAGFDIKGLWISGFQRRLTFKNAMFPFKVMSSLLKARSIITAFKPDAVIGFGGYASGAALWSANKMGIPTLIQEQNSYPGVTNKILGRTVDCVCVAYEESKGFFEGPKVVLTGNPVRGQLESMISKRQALQELNLDEEKSTILVVGGSLGARSINMALRDLTEELGGMKHAQVLWQCGSLYIEEYKNCATAQLDNVEITDFIEKMDVAYAAADVVVGRAGALTISELMLLGKAAILIPSPNVAEDHQTKNAMALVKTGAAILIQDNEIGSELINALAEVIDDEEYRKRLEKNIRLMARPDATSDIVNEIELLIKN